MLKKITYSFFLFFLLIFIKNPLCSYEVQFSGNIPAETLELLKTASQLVSLKNSPPATSSALRNRADSDINNLLKVLHSQAYFNAYIKIDLKLDQEPPLIVIHIETGPIYPINSFSVLPFDNSNCPRGLLESVFLEEIGIFLGKPAFPETILKAEENLLYFLARHGYPLAKIKKREVIADQSMQSINVDLYVECGPTATFGPISIQGNCTVLPAFFYKKIAWCRGSRFNPCKVEETQNALEASGLFTSVTITNDHILGNNHELPMRIEVIESKHRSIGWGITYNTQRGPGGTFEWEHRNIRGLGERFRFDTDIWRDQQELLLVYTTPDFLQRHRDLLWVMEFTHQTTKGYTESSFSLSRIIEQQISANTRISYGTMYKWLHDTRSDTNGEYNLFKIPLYLRWSNANSLLDPTDGKAVTLKVIPTFQFLHPRFGYCINTLVATHYTPLSHDHRFVLASKLTFGTIVGSSRRTIPASERFYEGTETTLRGYRYLSVSPIRDCDKPVGGRSELVFSFEFRIRATESFGWVAFYDIGNVYAEPFPQLDRKQLQSVGWGLRYHTPVGPIRFDFAVPLNPRCHLDNRFQIYLSIGQAF